MAARRPGARRPRKVRFRSHRGARSHGGSMFRAHRGYRKGGAVFKAHAARALKSHRAKPARPARAAKLTAFKGTGRKNPYPVRSKAAAYKAAGHHAPAGWSAKRKRLAKYRAVKAKRV